MLTACRRSVAPALAGAAAQRLTQLGEYVMQTKSLVWVFALVVLVGTESLQARTVESERPNEVTAPLASALGVRFVEGSTSLVIVERNGQEYVVDLVAKTIRENK